MVRRTVLVTVQTVGQDNITRLNSNVDRLQRNASTTTRTLGNLSSVASAIITSLAIRRLATYAESWINIQNRLRQVTTSSAELTDVTEDLFRVSQQARTGFSAVANLYFRVSNAADRLGASQQQVVGITESLSNQISAAGLTAQETNSVLLQTSQAFNSGRLNGEEFRALSEALPSVLAAVSAELGVSRDELQNLSRAGAITGQVLGNALINTLEESRVTIRNTQVSLSQSATLINNSLTRLVGTFDNTVGASAGVADGVRFIIDALDDLTSLVGTNLIGELIGTQFRGLNRDIESTLELLNLSEEALISTANTTGATLAQAFGNIVPNIRQFIQILTVEIASFLDRTAASFQFVFENLSTGNFGAVFRDEGQGVLEVLEEVRRSALQRIADERLADDNATAAILANIEARIQARRRERDERLARLNQDAPENLDVGTGDDDALSPSDQRAADRLQDRLANEELLVTRSLANQNRIRDGSLLEQEANEQQSFIRRIQALQSQEEQIIARIGEDNARRIGLLQQFTDLEVAITAQSQQRIASIRAQSARQQANAVLSSFAQIQQLNQRSLGLQRVAIVANTASAVIQSFNNAGGYPFGIVPAGIMAAIGARQLAQVGKSTISSPSGGGAAASPGITQPTLSQDPFITTESTQANEALNILRNQDPTQLYTNEQLRQIVASIASLENSGQL